jgi:ASC-1-like (ASCH) protein
MIDRSALRKIVDDFRKEIESCWSEESAYKVPEILGYGPHISGGQCAVTCLVLMDVLRDELPDEQIFLVSGQLQSISGEIVIRDHGWLRVGSGTEMTIADPTADQAESVSEKIIIGTVGELEKKGLRYIEKDVEDSHGESEHPKRFKRYLILKDAWDHRDMQTHEMKLVSRLFDDIVNGTKRFEIRLNDEKRKKIRIGDHIIFRKLPDLVSSIVVEVTSLKSYPDFLFMYDDLKSEYPDWEKGDWIKAMYAYYTPADEHSYGTLAIGIKLVQGSDDR